MDLLPRLGESHTDNRFVRKALVCIADPDDRYSLRAAERIDSSNAGVDCASVLLAGGPKCVDRLLRWAFLQSDVPEVFQLGVSDARPGAYASHCCGFLRSEDSRGVRSRIEAVFPQIPPHRQVYFKALLASYDYAAGLEPADRTAYRDFERRLWWYWALVSKSNVAAWQFSHAAALLAETWNPGDERFVVRIFREPASTREEANIALHLVQRANLLSIRKDLEEIAAGTSAQAATAQSALAHLNQRTEAPAPVGGLRQFTPAPPPRPVW
jgi:hypothetical protein